MWDLLWINFVPCWIECEATKMAVSECYWFYTMNTSLVWLFVDWNGGGVGDALVTFCVSLLNNEVVMWLGWWVDTVNDLRF